MKRIEVKFCGMKNVQDAILALSLGVSYVGFVVDVPESPRGVSGKDFFSLAREVKKNRSDAKVVAVTVDKSREELEEFLKSEFVDVLQLHGNESAELCAMLKKIKEVWKAINARDSDAIKKASEFHQNADRILLDTGNAQEKAKGTSDAFDAFEVFDKLKTQGIPLVLSGGLDEKNIVGYFRRLRPEIIDVSRGIESSPGEKSREKMKEFMNEVNEFNEFFTGHEL